MELFPWSPKRVKLHLKHTMVEWGKACSESSKTPRQGRIFGFLSSKYESI